MLMFPGRAGSELAWAKQQGAIDSSAFAVESLEAA